MPSNSAIQYLYRHKKKTPETVAALLTAALALAGLVLAAMVVPVFDLKQLGESIQSLFNVDYQNAPQRLTETDYGASGLAAIARKTSEQAQESLFQAADQLKNDRPTHQPLAASPLPASPRPASDASARLDFSASFSAEEKRLSSEIFTLHAPALPPRKGAGLAVFDTPDLGKLYAAAPEGGIGPGFPGGAGKTPEFAAPPEQGPKASWALARLSDRAIAQLEPGLAYAQTLVRPAPAPQYPSLDQDVDATFTVFREEGSDRKYFRLEIALRKDSKIPDLPKDVLFVVDTSRSIGREELDLMREGVLESLSRLPKDDRRNVAIFSEQSAWLAREFLPASAFAEKREQVRAFIARQEEQFRTNIFEAVNALLESLPGENRPCNVFLLTDAQATSGTGNVKRIVEGFSRGKRDRFSIFTFDAGEGGNKYLLELLSYRSRGFHHESPLLGQSQRELGAFARRFDRPVLANSVLSYTNMDQEEIYPRVLPCLYRDHPIVIWGRARTGDELTLRIAGIGAEGPREVYFRATVTQGETDHPELAQEWAQGKIHALMAALSQAPDRADLREAIKSLSEKYQLGSALPVITDTGFLAPLRRILDQ